MKNAESFSAGLLEAGASGYAAAAAARLLERSPETAARFGETAFHKWRQHLSHRLQQLSGALIVREPALFTADVVWSRTSFGSREVPLDDLRVSLECLRDTLAEELPADAAEAPARYLGASLEALDEARHEPSEPGAETPDGRLALRFLEAALEGDRRRAIDSILGAVDNGLSIADAYTRVLTTVQRKVGDLWHAGDVSVAQEHFVTAIVRDVMALLAHRAPRTETNGRGTLVGVAPGNTHEIAARALAHLLEIAGWRSVYLGGNLPASDLAIALEQFEAELLCLSVSLSTQLRGAMVGVTTAREVRSDLKVLVGGRVLEHAPEVWRALGADAGAASLEEAADAAARLVDGS